MLQTLDGSTRKNLTRCGKLSTVTWHWKGSKRGDKRSIRIRGPALNSIGQTVGTLIQSSKRPLHRSIGCSKIPLLIQILDWWDLNILARQGETYRIDPTTFEPFVHANFKSFTRMCPSKRFIEFSHCSLASGQAVAYVFILTSAAAHLPHVLSVENIPVYVRGRLSLYIHREQTRRQHGAGFRDHRSFKWYAQPFLLD